MNPTFSATYQDLLCAASGGNAQQVRQLLQRGAYAEATNGPHGCTALHAAAEAGDAWLVPILVAAGFHPNARTTDGRTPLLLAAGRRNLEVVAALLAAGASPRAADSNSDTPLHVAAGMGDASMIKALLAAGASVRAANQQGKTPLHMVCTGDHTRPEQWPAVTTPFRIWDPCPYDADRAQAARVLLRAGAAVHALNHDRQTPLQLACRYGHELPVDKLLSWGALPSTQDKRGWVPLHTASAYNQPGVVSRLLQLREVRGQLEAATSRGQTALVLACWAGHDKVVPLLLAAGVDVHALTPCGLRPLHAAVMQQQLSVLAQLLAAGADPCAVDRHEQSALQLAAAAGHRAAAQVLLAAGADPCAVNPRGRDALQLAAAAGHCATVQVLLAAGADSSTVNKQQQGALHMAAAAGHWETVQALLVRGADPHAVDHQQQSALLLAAAAGHTDTVRVLLAGVADPRAVDQQQQSVLHVAAAGQQAIVPVVLAAGADPCAEDQQGQSALHIAAAAGHWETAEVLLAGGSDPRAVNPQQQSALHIAAAAGHRDTVESLLAGGADPCALDHQQQSALHVAAAAGHSETVEVLLAGGADPRAADDQQQSVLHVAAAASKWPIVPMLLAAGADPCAVDKQQRGVLHVTGAAGHLDTVRMLLTAGADPNAVDQQQQSALHVAAGAGQWDVVPVLLAAGADPRLVDWRQQSVLRVAVSEGRPAMVQALLAAGADPGAVDEKQQTVLHVAIEAGRPAIAHMVLAALAVGKYRGNLDAMARGMTALHMAIQKGLTSCVKGLLAAGADPNKLLGEGAVDSSGTSVAGASSLWWAVLYRHADAIRMLSNPTSLRQRTWKGQTPLHQALYVDKLDIAQLLIAAGAPAGLYDNRGNTAMSLAVRSSNPAFRALLPAMARNECQLHLKQWQLHAEEEGGQEEHAAVPAAVKAVVYELLGAPAGVSEQQGMELAVACCSMVLEVMGSAAASRPLQQVLQRCIAPSKPAAAISCAMRLLRLAHMGWLAALEPLLLKRKTITSRLQWLVTQPLHQQQESSAAAMVGNKQQGSFGQLTAHLCKQLWGEALAAGDAGQWGLLVQRLEQLAGLQPSGCCSALYAVAAQKGWVRPPAVAGLCEALLSAWVAGQQQPEVTRRAAQEVADGVLSTVQAWEQQRVVSGCVRRRL